MMNRLAEHYSLDNDAALITTIFVETAMPLSHNSTCVATMVLLIDGKSRKAQYTEAWPSYSELLAFL